ncbi:tyrosine-type recombinase/integrase [Candidatus Lucifugimonas marina]|uniref:tyrosine-type recombinase/integrase n=1 Tax=Candidatus Lucifugimonas marina TaxID=3038979 RepID=UPI00319A2322|nr:tyrosine-type recombinase/integrase [SAR202 cluster bacterium JH639]
MTRGRPVKRRKRSSGEGTIFKRVIKGVDYWVFQITLPDGSRSNPKYVRSLELAKEALLKARTEIASGVLPSDMTFDDWAEHWVGTKSDVSQKTLDQYKRNLATATGIFGKKQLDKIQAHDLETMLKAIREEGRSSTSARQVFINVTGCLRAAYKRGLMVRDISEQVESPRAMKRKPVMLSRTDWQTLTNASRKSSRELIVEFTLKTGMRINEALSITWEQVDSDSSYMTVGESKTEAGAGRTIPVDNNLMERLTSLRAKHYERQMQDRSWNPAGFVFSTNSGKRGDKDNLQRWVLTPLLKEAGLPHLTWHHLRHNAGSYLLSENVPITLVSKILGHANPAITMSIYAHELKEDFEQVRVAMAKIG